MPNFLEPRPVVVCDTECLVNYWSIGFKSVDGRQRVFEHYEGNPLNRGAVAKIIRQWRIVTFNGIKYDIPMILLAMSGATNAELKQASDELIQYGTPHWVFMERNGLRIPEFLDHIDLIQVTPAAPQMPSLKMLGGRLHSTRMQEMPVAIDEYVTPASREVIRRYHGNDLDTTIDLMLDLRAQLEIRAVMSQKYGIDLRSKSDAQIAEAVIVAEVEKATGRKIYKPDVKEHSFKYSVPKWVHFETPYMQGVLDIIRKTNFYVASNGVVELPKSIADLHIQIGEGVYRMGIGGLHSSESSVSHYTDETHVIKDRDATSYYPRLIETLELYPRHMGPKFLEVYSGIIVRRVAAKKSIGTIGKRIDELKKRLVELRVQLKEAKLAESHVSPERDPS